MKNLLLLSTLFLSTVSMNAFAAESGVPEDEGEGRKSPVGQLMSDKSIEEIGEQAQKYINEVAKAIDEGASYNDLESALRYAEALNRLGKVTDDMSRREKMEALPCNMRAGMLAAVIREDAKYHEKADDIIKKLDELGIQEVSLEGEE